MFIVTRIWISISDLDLNSIIESHNENLKNLVNFIIVISWVAPRAIFPGVGRAARMSSQSVDLSSVDFPVGKIPWFLCASAEKLHERGPLPVKEIAIYYDRWEGEGFALFSPRYG